ncbi:MAG: hypothetical protein AB7F20_01990 [Geoalkalibacter sp.]|jgi:hypothetical protein|uniref:hypothetical protein n=1 Tax=Geoalkalibacter sp. TaxID=3041440 RepID=UPI002A99F2DD|nr:hypothetical protein [Thermodesulfobacteriota bacterium]
MSETIIPLNEAADRMQSTPVNVLMHIKRGLLRGQEINGSWFVDVSSLDKYLLLRPEDGVKSEVCQSRCDHKCSSCG